MVRWRVVKSTVLHLVARRKILFAQDFFESADGTCWCGLSFLYPLGGNIFGTELGRRTDAIVLADRIAMRVPYMQEDGRLCALCSNDVMSQLVREAQPALGDA